MCLISAELVVKRLRATLAGPAAEPAQGLRCRGLPRARSSSLPAGIAALDARWRLAAWSAPGRTAARCDRHGVLPRLGRRRHRDGRVREGRQPALVGVDLAPHLPLEEPFFLAFLCYLALVMWAAAASRARRERARMRAGRERSARLTYPLIVLPFVVVTLRCPSRRRGPRSGAAWRHPRSRPLVLVALTAVSTTS